MPSAFCPDCDEEIIMNPRATLGQKLNCPHCEAELEVISVEPLEFDWAYDWTWEEDEDEDDEDW
jgi:Zn-finger nucleic acid-binding protein